MVVSLGLAVGAAAAAAAEPDGLAATRNVTSAWEQVAVSGPPGMPGRRAEIAVADAVAPD